MILKKETKVFFSELGEKNWIYPSFSNFVVLSSDVEVELLNSLFSGNPDFLAAKVKSASDSLFEGQVLWFAKTPKQD